MGLIHLDAGVIIGFLDRNDAHHESARAILVNALDAGDHLAMAASAFAECLVGPARLGGDSIQVVQSMVERVPIAVVDLDATIAARAAALRAEHVALKLPDALVIATAACETADRLVTTDRHWPTAKAMKLTLEIEEL